MKASRAVAVLLALLLLVSCSHITEDPVSDEESGIAVSEALSEADPRIEESSEDPGVSAQSEEQSSSVPETSCAESAEESAEESTEESTEESNEASEEQSAETSEPCTAENVTVRINEIMASSSLYLSPEGKASDWIELYNYGASQVDLSGLYLTDNVKKPKKDPALCGVIEPGGVMLIFAGGDAVRENGVNVMGFTLAKGETVALCDPNGNVISSVEIPETLKKDRSYAYGGIVSASLVTDNRPEGYVDTAFCTPGYENGAEGYEKYIAEKDKTLGALV
ncbi:MAG: lamin tail domain-containing protein, partial [Clostridia bacterium]|nr:lamin tail domain-containing protein [Clostridia bacterium]